MSNDLITPEQMSFDEMARLTGQNNYDGDTASSLPWISVNKEGEDDEGNTIPVGHFMVTLPDVGKVFTKSVTFRPFMRGFQYRKFDADKGETTSKSKIIFAWSEEAYDTTGTVKCGKPKVKKGEFLTPDQEALSKSIKCYMLLWGVASFEGVNLKGEAVSIKDAAVGIRCRGLSFMAMGDAIDALTKKKRPMVNTELTLNLKKGKNGSNTYWTIDPTVNWQGQNVWRGEADFTLFKDFKEYVEILNSSIFAEYTKVVGKTAITVDDVATVEAVTGKKGRSKSLKDDFVDDINDPQDVDTILSAG